MRRRFVAVVLAVSIGAGAWALWPSPEHRLIYAESLTDGYVFQCFSDGATLGPGGSTVDVQHTRVPGGGSTEMAVSPPPLNEDQMRQAGDQYRKSGRNPERDQAEFDRLWDECERRQ